MGRHRTNSRTLLKHDNHSDTAAPNGRQGMELHEGDGLMAGSRRAIPKLGRASTPTRYVARAETVALVDVAISAITSSLAQPFSVMKISFAPSAGADICSRFDSANEVRTYACERGPASSALELGPSYLQLSLTTVSFTDDRSTGRHHVTRTAVVRLERERTTTTEPRANHGC